MINKLLPVFALTSLVMLGSCSTSKIVQTDVNDDVYYSVAEAKEATPVVYQQKEYVTSRDAYADEDSYSGYYDDYSVRINRFHRYSPWRSYYDTYYDPYYSPYSYNRYDRRGLNVNIYLGNSYGYGYNPYWMDSYYYGYGYYPYRPNYWGMNSYYNSYPYYPYYGGYYGNSGYYYGGMGRDVQSSPNYRPRPSRDFDAPNAIRRTTAPDRSGYAPGAGTITDTRSRTERYNDGNRVTPPSTTGSRTSSARPTRTESERPVRTSSAPSDDSRGSIQSRPTRVESSYPSSGSGSSSSSSGSSSGRSDSGSGSSSSSGRPTRGN